MQAAIPFPNISPEIFSFEVFGMTLALRWYALAYIVGILIGWALIRALIKREGLWPDAKAPLTAEALEALSTWIIIGIILGGRLGYVLFYAFDDYLANPLAILQVWRGGMSFHGGFAGVIVAVTLFSRKHALPLGSVADAFAVAAPMGLMLGRIANFINGELWGRVTDVPWAVVFPGQAANSCVSVLTECSRHPSQLYEAVLEGLILGLVLIFLAFRTGALRHRWLLTGVFLVGYGLSRFAVEFVRQPDAQFVTPDNPLGLYLHVGGWGLTAGQTLSLPMILIGVWLVWRRRRA